MDDILSNGALKSSGRLNQEIPKNEAIIISMVLETQICKENTIEENQYENCLKFIDNGDGMSEDDVENLYCTAFHNSK